MVTRNQMLQSAKGKKKSYQAQENTIIWHSNSHKKTIATTARTVDSSETSSISEHN